MGHSLHGRIAVVTGSTAGIGAAIARELAGAGARVVVNGRRAQRVQDVVHELAGPGAGVEARVVGAVGDAAEQDTIDAMLCAARAHFGAPADLVVANAGRGLKGGPIDSDESQWDEMIRTNIAGVARLVRTAARAMLEAPAGGTPPAPRDLIIIGSIVGRHVSPFSAMYGATKFAVHGLAEGVRRELGPKGIRVSLVEPGFVTSEFQGVAGYAPEWYKGVVEKIGPVLDPADVARAVCFIAAQPPHVHVSDVVVRPTRQEYP